MEGVPSFLRDIMCFLMSNVLLGNITAPKSRDGWESCGSTKGYLIIFSSVDGLTIDGPGQIDGQGSIWWPGPGDTPKNEQPTGLSCDCPSMLRFYKCNGLQVKGTRHINSPKCHISISGCHGVNLGHLHISAPEGTPNTDGINVSWSTDVDIHDCTIESGDDCVAISGGTSDINVTRILCGPGHGISIGSLGKNGFSTVENIKVRGCNLTGTQNGVRIKTVPQGTGYARGILFENINLVNVGKPIIIDQHYCNNAINRYCPAPPKAAAVKVSDVTYKGIYGSSATKQAIVLNCSGKYNCTRIVMNGVEITGDGVYASCENVDGMFIHTNPKISCN
ncbi:probable polygalacturonase At3g15720 [Rutidosis leptorrhynchoides]|uniref:probable polygalacturonase At3g15720 n=1 Tax=Rutidosis leptorrhynchoides TaxID=125765 RepID=UPI003A99197A